MARLRTLKPGFFTNDELTDLPPLTRLMFAGLWCLADREGRLIDRPKRIKAEILPYDNGNPETMLAALAAKGFILRYTVGDDQLIQIINFAKHQTPHYKEALSVIPAPPGHVDSGVLCGAVGAAQRDRIIARDGARCVRCGSTERLTIDHVVARSKGGSGDDDNLQVLCHRCNSRKGNRILRPITIEQSSYVGSTSDDGLPVDATSGQRRVNVDPTLDEQERELRHGNLELGSGDLGVGSGDLAHEERAPDQRLLRVRAMARPDPSVEPATPQTAVMRALAASLHCDEPSTKSERRVWVEAVEEMLHADPPVTQGEIPRLVTRWPVLFSVPPTPKGMAAHLSRLRSEEVPQPRVSPAANGHGREPISTQLDRIFGSAG